MEQHFLNRPKIPAAMAFLILPICLTGCGLTTGFGVAARPSSDIIWRASNSSEASPDVAPSPVPLAAPPAIDTVAVSRSSGYQDEVNVEVQPDKPNDGQYNIADTKAEFVALKKTQTVEERPAAEKARVPRHVEHVDDHDFQQKVVRSDETVLVDFYADWCGPCKMLVPVLDELAQETPDARIVKVDIDQSPKLAKRYGVRSIPTLILFKDGKPVTRRTGLNSKASLKELIAQ
jgi:thioredoxin 1